ncbi:hypothetical protein B723_04230 [Pseudomonas fluorescens NCIMB 11764]|uniref:Uncharacterized protein n=1 Tax=Pseudomonas fluorescens NCIMB 11764 TaxID=1221522 RepID=A0A0K1QJ04_PSEFL|nr:hypothetical protein B723_04230 [Pseudomonas fluorescens NCIMB 11764]
MSRIGINLIQRTVGPHASMVNFPRNQNKDILYILNRIKKYRLDLRRRTSNIIFINQLSSRYSIVIFHIED